MAAVDGAVGDRRPSARTQDTARTDRRGGPRSAGPRRPGSSREAWSSTISEIVLDVGAQIPDVTVAGQEGEPVALAALAAEGPLLLAFYLFDWTGT